MLSVAFAGTFAASLEERVRDHLVTACDILHQEVMRFRRDKKIPVVASILDQGTSGAYYIAAAADRIIGAPVPKANGRLASTFGYSTPKYGKIAV